MISLPFEKEVVGNGNSLAVNMTKELTRLGVKKGDTVIITIATKSTE